MVHEINLFSFIFDNSIYFLYFCTKLIGIIRGVEQGLGCENQQDCIADIDFHINGTFR
jgi:hypothetical protein